MSHESDLRDELAGVRLRAAQLERSMRSVQIGCIIALVVGLPMAFIHWPTGIWIGVIASVFVLKP